MRLQHVDIARGLCILLVALGHNMIVVPPDSAFNHMLGTIRMPLLFLIAGTFFNPAQPLSQLARQKADALIKPFLVMALLHAPFRMLIWQVPPLDYGLGVLSGSGNYLPWLYALWFLPHLWLVFVLAWLMHHGAARLGLKLAEQVMLLATLLMAGFVLLPTFWMKEVQFAGLHLTLKGLPFSADLLPISTFFFMVGMMVRKPFLAMSFRLPALLLALGVFGWTQLLYQPEVSMFERRYSHLFACTAAALAGITVMLELSIALVKLPRIGRPLAHCGINSLFILIFHSPIQSATRGLLDSWWGRGSMLSASLAYIACILSSLILARLIRQHTALRILFLPLHKTRPAPLPTIRAWEALDTLPDEADTVPVARRA